MQIWLNASTALTIKRYSKKQDTLAQLDDAERIKEKVKWGRLVNPVDNYRAPVMKRPHFTFSDIPSKFAPG